MYQIKRSYLLPNMKLGDIIIENPSFLLLMERFNLDFIVGDKTISQLCKEMEINEMVLITLTNLYNGFALTGHEKFEIPDIAQIIQFLRNTHIYFEDEKLPEIHNYIEKLSEVNESPEIKLIRKFFNEYNEEVKEHFAYENKIVFPYFYTVLGTDVDKNGKYIIKEFSTSEYKEHHSDVETKLNDLRELLLNHIPVHKDRVLRRKIITALFEIEYDLNVHTTIEETLLIPLITELEKAQIE